jgi:hypothetical protein
MADKTKILTKVQSFDDVQKSLQDIETRLNELNSATNTESEGQVENTEGKTGDIRITRGADKNYSFEVMTEEGWKFGSLGGKPIQFTDKPAEFSKPTAIPSGNLPNPDYESEWTNIPDTRVVQFTHELGRVPSFVQMLGTNDAGETVHQGWHTEAGHAYDILYTDTYIWLCGGNKWGYMYNNLEWSDKNVMQQTAEFDAIDYWQDMTTQKWQF